MDDGCLGRLKIISLYKRFCYRKVACSENIMPYIRRGGEGETRSRVAVKTCDVHFGLALRQWESRRRTEVEGDGT